MVPASIIITYSQNYKSFDDGLEIRSFFLDISKSFNNVWHEGFILKLEQNDISGDLLNILRDFLNNRKQRLVLNGQVSAWTNANAGVPQGSISCPLLFLVWNKVFKNVPSKICGRQPLRNLK